MNRTNQRKIHLHVKSLRQRFAALLLAFCCFALLLGAPAGMGPASAKESSGETMAIDFFDGILSYLAAADGYSLADPQVILNEGSTKPLPLDLWYIFALSQHGAFDFRTAAQSMRASLLWLSSPLQGTTLQKYALVSLAIGDDLSAYDSSLLADSVGSQGIMSLVFGLHLLNNGASLSSHTPQETVRRILSLRLADGGWAITGEFGDVDVTSMVVQALAPYCRSAAGSSDAEAAAAIDGAITLLSSRQNADGGFTSYGSANCESCVQVLVALSSVGIDASSDARFLKNGKSVFDAIASYRMPDGSFRHIQSGETNRTATQQVFYGCVAYLRFLSGRPSLYELDAVREGRGLVPTGAPSATVTPVAALTPTAAVASPTAAPAVSPAGSAKTGANGSGIPPYRLIGTGVIIFLCGFAFAVLGAKKRLTKRNALLAAFSAIALLVLLWIVKIQTPSQYYAELGVSEEEAAGVVTLSVRCDTVAGENGLPADGVILAPVRVPFREGDTVYNALTVAAASAGLPLDVGGLGTGGYIRGIGTLREFDFGSLSGWMYYVNGEAPSESCNSRRLADGDVIEWRYTRDLGADTE